MTVQIMKMWISKAKPGYSLDDTVKLYKNAAAARGVKFNSFTGATFEVESKYAKTLTDVLIATGVQANLVSTRDVAVSSGGSSAGGSSSGGGGAFNPSNYSPYPVKQGEYAYMIAQKFTGNSNRWTEIGRQSTGLLLTDASARNLKLGENLMIPKTWIKDGEIKPDGTVAPKKSDGGGLLLIAALGYGAYEFLS
jgi:hypothetical protein